VLKLRNKHGCNLSMSLTLDLKRETANRRLSGSAVSVASLDTSLVPEAHFVLDMSQLVMPAANLSPEERARLASVQLSTQGPTSELRKLAQRYRLELAEAELRTMGQREVSGRDNGVEELWRNFLGISDPVESGRSSLSLAI
jgi:hypothetical protein